MTKDELDQIKQLLAENNKQLDQNFRKLLKEIKAEVDPLHERMDAQREHINRVRQELREDIQAVEQNLSETIRQEAHVISDYFIEHDRQIEELQKAVGLKPKGN